jgi:hypothetical protein
MSETPQTPAGLDVHQFAANDVRLGRHKVHDERSRAFAMATPINKATWKPTLIPIYDPSPLPNQTTGNCTAVAKCVQLNATGNRKPYRVLDLSTAEAMYERETQIDPFPGTYPPDDTGSDGLSSCKVAVEKGLGGAYRWLFGGADEVVQNIVEGRVISVGTRWDNDMFNQDADGRVHLGGGVAGGHQYAVHGYDHHRDWVLGRCWWGSFGDFWIARADLDTLLADGGDAHFQATA